YRISGLRLSSSLNYTGALQDKRFPAEARIAPSATLDMGASYDVIAGKGAEPALSLSITINNVFNDKPDLIRTTGPTDTPYDSTKFFADRTFHCCWHPEVLVMSLLLASMLAATIVPT